MPPRPSIKNLQDEILLLQGRVTEAEANKILAETSLAEAEAKIQQQATALAEALARIQVQGNVNASDDETSQIDRPKPLTKGGRIPIQAAMGLEGQDELYGNIQKYIHTLVAMCGIDWKQDFRLQSADNLSKLYRAARKEYPMLKRFKNDWATADLLKMYLQNTREHARTRGYIPRAGRKAAAPRTGSASRVSRNNENVVPETSTSSSSRSGSRHQGRRRGQ